MSQTSSFSLPIGPVHVALEEPVYFHLDVDGETVRKVEIDHRHRQHSQSAPGRRPRPQKRGRREQP